MTKQLTALLLVLCTAFALFAGCGEVAPPESEQPTVPTTTAPTEPPVPTGPHQTYLSEAEMAKLKAERTETTDAPPLCINGTEAIFEQERQCYFFSVKADEVWEALTPSAEGWQVQYVTDFESEDKVSFVKGNEPVLVFLYNDTAFATAEVLFTTLPVLSMNTATLPAEYTYHDAGEEYEKRYDSEGEEIPYEPYAAPPTDRDRPIGDYDTFLTMTLLDAEAQQNGYENGFTTIARAHIRGRSSRKYPKNSYKLELLKEKDGVLKERDETLLGMRNDGDWNLNGMYAEPSKVRDKVSADLWLALTEDRETEGYSNGYRCEYIEVIINGYYHGLYLMTERIDHKQLGLKDGDRLYFSEGDLGKWYTDYLRTDDPTDREISGYSLKWPKEFTEPYTEWVAFGEFCKLIQSTHAKDFKVEAPKMIDLESLMDYELFVQAVCGVDNLIQNTYYVARQQEDGEYRFSFIPWDMDQTFGMRWSGMDPLLVYEDYGGVEHHSLNFWVSDIVGNRNTDGYEDRIRERYTALRKTLLDDKEMIKRVNQAQALLTESGAWVRNQQRWPEGAYSSVSRIRGFITERMKFLDEQYLVR
ncbi:MAG: CotH kinase family protein [Clostridia bacterium]|nr:CotH kinase family protein [Clostridia bacterium]